MASATAPPADATARHGLARRAACSCPQKQPALAGGDLADGGRLDALRAQLLGLDAAPLRGGDEQRTARDEGERVTEK